MDRRHTRPAPLAGPAWAGWLYLGLAVLAGAQLVATVWQSGAGEATFLPSLVGVIAFPALAGAALLKRR
ncbi:hypothetical protein [Streptomyces lydicus]|uniref:hypothetical protein n=1 Tax=Streptomyces lydicus TaxID=47763 RepID=UPI000A76C915|nr:hypothetical protein [Streptomyces lydicus]MDC7335274.1 hypothetical protein [Streptomyces lydicus]